MNELAEYRFFPDCISDESLHLEKWELYDYDEYSKRLDRGNQLRSIAMNKLHNDLYQFNDIDKDGNLVGGMKKDLLIEENYTDEDKIFIEKKMENMRKDLAWEGYNNEEIKLIIKEIDDGDYFGNSLRYHKENLKNPQWDDEGYENPKYFTIKRFKLKKEIEVKVDLLFAAKKKVHESREQNEYDDNDFYEKTSAVIREEEELSKLEAIELSSDLSQDSGYKWNKKGVILRNHSSN